MKFTIDRKPFLAALKQAGAALPAKTSLPILQSFRLALSGDALSITATDLEIGIVRTIARDGEPSLRIAEDGIAAVTADQLTGFLGALPEGAQVAIEYDAEKHRLRLRAGNARAAISCYDPDDYPDYFGGDTARAVPIARIPAREVRAAIQAVAFAAIQGADNRAALLSICLGFVGDRLTLSAADGYRMAVRHLTLATPPRDDVTILPPATALVKLAKLLDAEDDAPVELLHRGRNLLIARAAGLQFASRLIEGVFPRWDQLIGGGTYGTRVVAPAAALVSAAKVAAALEPDKDRALLLAIAPGYEGTPGTVEITGTGDNRQNGDTLDAVIAGPPVKIGARAQYLTEAIGALTTPTVAIELQHEFGNFLVKPVGGDDALHIIMPMSIAGETTERVPEAVAAD